uniref:Uncharacterized protein n=1 Tax=Spongospora subterranea TaxID=70186 RepID=A0A0H5QYY9_9EUKA|eukprot:CRZ07198.1 hypothetical protein [Spongospora subterranea]
MQLEHILKQTSVEYTAARKQLMDSSFCSDNATSNCSMPLTSNRKLQSFFGRFDNKTVGRLRANDLMGSDLIAACNSAGGVFLLETMPASVITDKLPVLRLETGGTMNACNGGVTAAADELRRAASRERFGSLQSGPRLLTRRVGATTAADVDTSDDPRPMATASVSGMMNRSRVVTQVFKGKYEAIQEGTGRNKLTDW